jgi:hypothetical protein
MLKQNSLSGHDLLRNPSLNKGTAFTEAERRQYHLEDLLPPGVSSLALQVARTHAELAALDNDLQKYLLSDLRLETKLCSVSDGASNVSSLTAAARNSEIDQSQLW